MSIEPIPSQLPPQSNGAQFSNGKGGNLGGPFTGQNGKGHASNPGSGTTPSLPTHPIQRPAHLGRPMAIDPTEIGLIPLNAAISTEDHSEHVHAKVRDGRRNKPKKKKAPDEPDIEPCAEAQDSADS